MSWSLTATVTSTDSELVGAAIDEALAALTKDYEVSDYALSDESKEQIGIAKAAAIEIAKSGAIGTGVGINISLSGHGNPEHKPPAGYPTDQISVIVTQKSA